VKVLSPQLAATSPARKRFLREARSSAQVRHENVVQVYEVGEQPLPHLVMEFIPGETLQQRLDRIGPLDVPDILRIGRQIAEGLAAAHATDLIHRDIKPGNILLEGGQQRVKITDFGLARAADDASISQSGIIAGTPMFMAPEQAKGDHLDHRADLFSLGSVLYQMVAGRPPFRATTTLAVLKRVAEDDPRPIREIIPEAPQWLCDIISKLHAKNPDNRFQTAREVADLLADCEAQLKENAKLKDFSRIPKNKRPAAKSSGRWKWVVAAVLLLPVLALAVTEIAGVTHLVRNPKQETTDPIKPGDGPAPDRGVLGSEGWFQLFNGKDLTGWKTRPEAPGRWEVKDGILIGSRLPSVLYSERGDYANFHLRVETKVNLGGDSGVFFRAGFGTPLENQARKLGPDGGFEVEIHKNLTYARKTGTIQALQDGAPPLILGLTTDDSLTQPNEWFTLEIIVEQNHFISKVNGKETANCRDPLGKYSSGHIGLQVWSPNTVVQFRKIEIK
jgi:serine/threonine protein kinase